MAKEEIVHHFEWGAGNYQVEIHLPRKIRQISSIEQAVKESYIPYQVIALPISSRNFIAIDPDREKNTCKGFSAILKLGELDVPDPADAYVPSGICFEDKNIPRQFIVSLLYFRKP
jgi:hypothetical protein